MAKKIIMHRKNATGYDEITPDTHISQINCSPEVMFDVGADFSAGDDIMNHISATDKMISGYGTTSGTSKAYTLSLEGKPDMAIVDGMMIRAKFHVANDEEPTINVNGSGAKNIYGLNQLKILYTIGAGVWAVLMYSSALNGWIVQGWAKKKVYHTEIITETTSWKVPEYVGSIGVRLFGGGSGGQNGDVGGVLPIMFYFSGAGGGGGHMNYANINPRIEENVLITIGAGGSAPSSTSHKLWGGAGGTTSFGNYLSANGGSGVNGGSGGGDGSVRNGGGNGSYGGGGGGCYHTSSTGDYYSKGGNGGTYGGGGYGRQGGTARNGMFSSSYRYGAGYMANASSSSPGNGLNTIGMGLDFEGEGKAGTGGGGGYGGNGGGSGGGGYGGNGGNGTSEICGGGGGYGGNGGNDGVNNYGGGGGGGYGASGNGGSGGNNAGYAAGGCGGDELNNTCGQAGGSGLCILSYWSWDVDV